MKSFMLRKEDVSRDWYIADAKDAVLGRLASEVAIRLMGKTKPSYTFHTDNGDYVIITNAQDVKITGRKSKDKIYYRHSRKPGNLKSRNYEQMMERDPRKVIELAVRRMLPKNRIAKGMLCRLRIFNDEKHAHEAQNPQKLNIQETK